MQDKRWQVVLVTYELSDQRKQEAITAILRTKSRHWWHHFTSTWLVVTDQSTEELAGNILPLLDKQDRLLVVKLAADYQGWLPERAWDWITKHLPESQDPKSS